MAISREDYQKAFDEYSDILEFKEGDIVKIRTKLTMDQAFLDKGARESYWHPTRGSRHDLMGLPVLIKHIGTIENRENASYHYNVIVEPVPDYEYSLPGAPGRLYLSNLTLFELESNFDPFKEIFDVKGVHDFQKALGNLFLETGKLE